MSKLYIAEYARMCQAYNAGPQCPEEPPLVEQVVDFSGGVANSAPFNTLTSVLRLHCDAVCSILIGATVPTPPTATISNQRYAQNQTEFKGVKTGGQYQISVISNT